MKFLLEIVTPDRRAFSQEVDAITVPTYRGTVGVLAHHMPLFAALSEGEVKITDGTKEMYLAIGGGFMEVATGKVSILVSRAVHADELNESEIKKAQLEAKEALSRKLTTAELGAAQALMRRSTVELSLLRRFRRRASPLPVSRS